MDEQCKLKDRNNAFQMYELYINRHFKGGDWYWSRFKIYLSLNTGIVVIAGLLFKEYLDKLPFDTPFLWIINSVMFGVGIQLARVWKKVNEDGRRWQLIIDEYIAALEPELFEEGNGLYTAILKEYKKTKGQKGKEEDVADINIRLARFFFWLWVIALGVSILFIILTLVCSIFRWATEFI